MSVKTSESFEKMSNFSKTIALDTIGPKTKLIVLLYLIPSIATFYLGMKRYSSVGS